MKHITIKDIARESGFSIASVSRALNGMQGISPKNREKILEVCKKLNYTPNGLARSLVKRSTRMLGIIVPDIMSPFYSELMVKASDAVHKRGYQVLLCNSFREVKAEEEYLRLMVENQVEGILIFPVGKKSEANIQKYMRNIPIISLNETTEKSGIPYVCADEERAGRIATEHLIHNGCRNLMFVGFKPDRIAHRYRVNSFLKTTRERGILARVYESTTDFRTSFERGYDHFRQFLLSGEEMPDGILAASDDTANGIIKACKEYGKKIPEDFSLIGFDNISMKLSCTELTTVAVSHDIQIEIAVNLLLEIIRESHLVDHQYRIKLEPKLVERKSCKRV